MDLQQMRAALSNIFAAASTGASQRQNHDTSRSKSPPPTDMDEGSFPATQPYEPSPLSASMLSARAGPNKLILPVDSEHDPALETDYEDSPLNAQVDDNDVDRTHPASNLDWASDPDKIGADLDLKSQAQQSREFRREVRRLAGIDFCKTWQLGNERKKEGMISSTPPPRAHNFHTMLTFCCKV